MDATHTRGTLDANDTFQIVNGELKVTTSRGDVYALEDGKVKAAGAKLNGSITAESKLFASQPEDVVEFSYDHNGLRTQKKVTKADGAVEATDYVLHGKLLTHLTRGSDEMHFFYDGLGQPAMVNFNGTLYSYVHNLQGDVVGIVDSAGSLVVEYKYDAWGKPTLVRTLTAAYEALAELNPFRYRGYVYDEEVELYYLKTRYFSPDIQRFVNIDGYIINTDGISDENLFGYCGNNPVMRKDPCGEAWWHWLAGAAIVAACAVAVVITAGGAMAGAVAVASVANGLAAASTSTTIAAGAFIGSSVAYSAAAITAASESSDIEDFGRRGNLNTVFTTAGGMAFGALYGYRLYGYRTAQSRKTLARTASRGSTGRTVPRNLHEQLSMQEVLDDPLRGAKRLGGVHMTDPRWPETEGWVKMARNSHGVEIHFVYNPRYGLFDDFKFK